MKKTLRDRFYEKVNLYHGITDEDCWEWIGAKTNKGYGRFSFECKNDRATKISWYLSKRVKNSLWLLHKCDTPSCVNPSHLFEGTPGDNSKDMHSKNRHRVNPRKGIMHGRAKLTDAEVFQIRESQKTQKETASRFGVSGAVVSSIRTRKTWRHI